MSLEFQRAVLRELDQIVKRFEEAIEKLERRDEDRDEEVSALKLEVGLLRGECRRNIKRDGVLVLAPTTLTAIITAVITAVNQAPAAPPQPAPIAAVARCGDGIVQTGERCDDGVNDGRPGLCRPDCRGVTQVAE